MQYANTLNFDLFKVRNRARYEVSKMIYMVPIYRKNQTLN